AQRRAGGGQCRRDGPDPVGRRHGRAQPRHRDRARVSAGALSPALYEPAAVRRRPRSAKSSSRGHRLTRRSHVAALRHLPADTDADTVMAAVDADGAVILDDVLDAATVDAVMAELNPYIEAT